MLNLDKNKKWQTQLSVTLEDKTKKCIYGGQFENINDAIEKRKQMNIEYRYHENHGKQNIKFS